mmetsp:Transcript_11812/g.15432  ORF Transcript_11812/g.15432 Transcript_11812/m.15432 type:complete len:415 (+) Transcript_11812:154-1398(+)|eukprot:CAMPEP_0117753492 /NCGR_PEP_ID=MMETSP0947-20121206/12259_1 /TAXON_ID=44440 /ORGANISM="Chattonella subsalsa, Strain CCMP2191" /LENGTH=414 /DNA_ID=CAMNT_0005572387 /DNA_START=65 /DNA_END=1309 /DNA_ORIENTATION=+
MAWGVTLSAVLLVSWIVLPYFQVHEVQKVRLSPDGDLFTQELPEALAAIHMDRKLAGHVGFTTPVRLFKSPHGGFKVLTCELRWDAYASNPPQIPMFRDLVQFSGCEAKGKSKVWDLEEIKEVFLRPSKAFRVLRPTGFIFHMSRVGSTLAANMLGVDSEKLVYSESHPPLEAIKLCTKCMEDQKVDLLQTIISLMGRSNQHKYLFFKFQSVATFHLPLFQTAFPETPWIFIFRDPVEVLISHFQPFAQFRKSMVTVTNTHPGPKCARGISNPPDEVLAQLNKFPSTGITKVDYCAAHVAALCSAAYQALVSPNNHGKAVEYQNLTDLFPTDIMWGHFQVDGHSSSVIKAMANIANVYSKSGKLNPTKQNSSRSIFIDDSTEKQQKAWPEIKDASGRFASFVYNELLQLSVPAE